MNWINLGILAASTVSLVPAAEFDPTSYTLRTLLNGEVVQEATAGDLLFPVAYQLADLSRTITLEPGDVVLTGTPANSRPMRPGDVVEVEITGLGRLTNEVVEWDVDLAGPGEQLQVSAQTLHVALAIPEDEAAEEVRRSEKTFGLIAEVWVGGRRHSSTPFPDNVATYVADYQRRQEEAAADEARRKGGLGGEGE